LRRLGFIYERASDTHDRSSIRAISARIFRQLFAKREIKRTVIDAGAIWVEGDRGEGWLATLTVPELGFHGNPST
jgi:hypothetical protein